MRFLHQLGCGRGTGGWPEGEHISCPLDELGDGVAAVESQSRVPTELTDRLVGPKQRGDLFYEEATVHAQEIGGGSPGRPQPAELTG